MSLRVLMECLNRGVKGALENVVLQVVHETLAEMEAERAARESEVASLREMVCRLEDRMLAAVEAVRAGAAHERDVLAAAIERHVGPGE